MTTSQNTFTVSDSLIKQILRKLVNEAVEGGNAAVHVRYYALKENNLTENSPLEDIEDAIEVYMYNLHSDMNYQGIIDQIDSNLIVKDLWNEIKNR